MTRYTLLTVISAMTLTFSGTFMVAGLSEATALAFALGALWLIVELRWEQPLPSAFFLIFTGLAIWGSLQGLSILLMLFGLSLTLAAWDLSRFRARVHAVDSDSIPHELEIQHLRKLALIAVAGFVIALLPLVVRLSINLVALAVLVLLLMFVLRNAVLRLRDADRADT